MFGLPIDPELLALVAAGVAATGSVLSFYYFFVPNAADSNMKKRLTNVRERRAELRDVHLRSKDQKARAAERNLAMMKNALEKLKMEEMISDNELKMSLASAGYRGRNAAVRFLFIRAVAPFVAAIATFLYLKFFMQPEDWNMTQYAMAVLLGGVAGYYLPTMILTSQRQKRQQNILRAYPDALDLLTICVEAGMSIEQAFNKVSNEISAQSIPLMEELQLTTAELSYIGDRRLAFDNFAERTQLSQVRSIASALVQAEKYGTPIGQALRVISQESRDERMSRAEQKAASLPAKLTVPMMVFFVPVLFIVILGPAILQVMEKWQ